MFGTSHTSSLRWPLLAGICLLALAALVVSTRPADVGGSASAALRSHKAGVQVGDGIARVRIGFTRKHVRRVLGPPRGVDVIRNSAFGPGKPVRYRYKGLRVLFWKGAPRNPSGSKPPDRRLRVAAVSTVRKSQVTKRGIGIGSSERQVKRKVAGAKCETLTFNGRHYRNCHVGNYQCKPPP